MSNWSDYVTELATDFDNLRAADEGPGDPPVIATPIDKGAKQLLTPHNANWIEYPALEVEYLIRTLNDHIRNCMEIRERAQDLEARAITETTEMQLQLAILTSLDQQATDAAANEPNLLANLQQVRLTDSNEVVGTVTDYWTKVAAHRKAQLKAQRDHARMRLEHMKEQGSGANYVGRFLALKAAFEVDLQEAYLRARAAAYGLRHVYGLASPVPELTDVGYLDKLAQWSREATYALEKRLFKVYESVFGFTLKTTAGFDLPVMMSDSDFKNAATAGAFTFRLDDALLTRLNVVLRNPRLRGLDVQVDYAGAPPIQRFFLARVRLPKQVVRGDGTQTREQLPMVLVPVASHPLFRPTYIDVAGQRETHNVDPRGEWEIRFEKGDWWTQNAASTASGTITNVIVRVRIAYEVD